jgi:hypothetical protein
VARNPGIIETGRHEVVEIPPVSESPAKDFRPGVKLAKDQVVPFLQLLRGHLCRLVYHMGKIIFGPVIGKDAAFFLELHEHLSAR